MTIQVVLGALGALLLLTAVLGGGFELRELKVPRVGRFARGAAGILGGLCVLFAVSLAQVETDSQVARADPPQLPMSTPTPTPTPASPVHVELTDELGDAQVSESVSVIFDGRNVGELKVDSDYPTAELEMTLPAAGRYDYTLASDSQELTDDGDVVEISGSGTGSVAVSDGDSLDVQLADNGQSRTVTFVQN